MSIPIFDVFNNAFNQLTSRIKTENNITSGNASSNSASTAYVASQVVKASTGFLVGLTGYNSKNVGQFIQIHDSATLPADTAIPAAIVWVSPQSSFSLDLGTYGRNFVNGIVICNSSTGPTKTIGSADCWFDVQYK